MLLYGLGDSTQAIVDGVQLSWRESADDFFVSFLVLMLRVVQMTREDDNLGFLFFSLICSASFTAVSIVDALGRLILSFPNL